VSTDGGRSWTQASFIGDVLPHAHARFELMWKWDGAPARLMSRAIDETGYAQPTLAEFTKARGNGTDYHFNYIRAWDVASDGSVTFAGTA
jgi:sulfane dehydrogenase subunit SoxC